MITKKQKIQLLYFLLTVIWGGFIFYLSSIPDLQSGLLNWQDLILRKLAHATVFFILTYLIISSLSSHQRPYLFFAIVVSISYAVIDELHQVGVLNRSGNPYDVLIDSFGVFWGMLVYKYRHQKITRFLDDND